MTDKSAPIAVTTSGASGPYKVLVGRGLLDSLPALLEEYAPAHRYALISDSNVAAIYGESTILQLKDAGLEAELFTFEAGERNKNRSTWSDLTDRLLRAGFGRDACLIAMGGGVTGDLGGFVAATYLRGIPVVQVPTSLVAMIDASIGGKTGVDVDAGKNLVGAFHPPNLVVADPDVVKTLPRAERAQGMVEAVKHGAIMDDEVNVLEGNFQRSLLFSPGIRLAGGTDEVMRNIIAEQVLGLPQEPRADKGIAFNEIPTGNS